MKLLTAFTAFLLVTATTLPAAHAADLEETVSPWMIRIRGLAVVPEQHSKLKLDGDRVPGHRNLHINTYVIPEVDFTYFFDEHFAAELILGTTHHKVHGRRELKAVGEIGTTWILPPTLTAQYHFDLGDSIKPYVGVGLNYTVFYSEHAKGDFKKFRLKDTWGVALQAGVDFKIDRHWGVNLDVKKIMMRPHASVNSGLVRGRVHIDPWLVGGGISYRF